MEEIKDLTVWRLANIADCYGPDSETSAGAEFLRSVRDRVWEAWQDGRFEAKDDGDVISEISDGSPDVYTHQRWSEFVDLGAYREDPESGEWPDDLTDAAGVALYQIAERLAGELVAYLRTPDDQD